jgi:hypothetical protein
MIGAGIQHDIWITLRTARWSGAGVCIMPIRNPGAIVFEALVT